MNYQIHITQVAEKDISNALDYIEFVLKSSKAANDLLKETEIKINALALFPKKFSLADDPILSSWGIRFTIVKNYLVFFVIFEEEHRVIIVRFLYGKSNWNSILKQGIPLF